MGAQKEKISEKTAKVMCGLSAVASLTIAISGGC